MKTQCPYCNSKFKAPDKIAGKETKCPKCKQHFKIVSILEVEELEYSQGSEKQISAKLPNESVNNRKYCHKVLSIAIAAGILLGIFMIIFLPENKLHNSLSDHFAEWFFAFTTTHVTVKIVLLIVNIPIYFLLARLIFGFLKRFWRLEKYNYMPNFYILLSRRGRNMMRRDYQEGYFSWKEVTLHILHCCLFVAVYSVQYLLVKIIFLN